MTDSSDSFLPCGFEKRTMRALRAFGDREGHVDVPDGHIEHVDDVAVSLGAWVGEMHVAYSRDELAPEQVAVLKAVPGWLWAFPPASLDIDTADEADLARWFKNDTDFQIWMTAHAAWLDRDTSATSVENAKVAVATEPGLADELGIVIERPSTPEPDLDDDLEDELVAWLRGQTAPSCTASETTATTAAASVVAHPGKPWVSYCLLLDDKPFRVLLETSPFRPGGPRSLSDVAEDFNVTREAIRRIRIRTAEKLLARQPSVADAANRLSSLLKQGVIANRLTTAGFDPNNPETQILASLADAARLFGISNGGRSLPVWTDRIAGDMWYGTGLSPAGWLDDVLDDHNGFIDFSACEAAFLDRFDLSRPNLTGANWFARYVDGCDGLRTEGGYLIRTAGTIIQRIVTELALRGEPMTTEELSAKFDPAQARSVKGRLIEEHKRGSLVVKTTEKTWALSDWDVDRHQTGEELLSAIIEEHGGQAGLRKLTREALNRSTFSKASIAMWASMSHRFVCENDVVRLRRDDELIAVHPPSGHAAVYRRVDSADPGCWSTVIDVSYEQIRAQSTTIPAPFVALLGMSDGNSKKISCNGVEVPASVNQSVVALASRNGWRQVVKDLGAVDGDRVIFTALPDGDATATLAPAVTSTSENVNFIRALIGGDGGTGLLEDFAYAVGVSDEPGDDFLLDELDERLTQRRSPDVREALNAIHPELFDLDQ